MLLYIALLPLAAGAFLPLLRLKSRKWRSVYVEVFTLLTSLLVYAGLFHGENSVVNLFPVTDRFGFAFSLDVTGKIYLGLAAFLWPFSTLYAFEYMKHEERENTFFCFFTMTYGIVILLSVAANLFTLYVFYELLTLCTLPLVWHKLDKPSIRAARKYVLYSIGGASLGFISMIWLSVYSSEYFVYGGSLSGAAKTGAMLLMFVFSFVGFGTKAAVFPMSTWLPAAAAAPTPVTALLHAVAVVNAGVFAIIRVIYYVFGAEYLSGTWAQTAALILSIFTLLYAAVMAIREHRVKQRLAWSTVSNLSYMLFAASLMTSEGMTSALFHMVAHGFMKITLFFCAGALLVQTGRTRVREMHGMAKAMPWTFGALTLASVALTGVPPFPGFLSKLYIITAAINEGGKLAAVGAAAVTIAGVLTFIYTFSVILPAYFMQLNPEGLSEGRHDPGWCMLVPLFLLCIAILVLGLWSAPIMNLISSGAGL